MGLSLPYADEQRYRAYKMSRYAGASLRCAEKFIDNLLKQQAPENAFDEFRKRPYNAGPLLGQEQSEIAGRLGTGVNNLSAPIKQGLTKALQNIEQSGELEKFDVWSKDAGQRLSSFFEKIIEPKLPGALEKLEDLIDGISGRIDKLSQGKDWNPETEQDPHWKQHPLG